MVHEVTTAIPLPIAAIEEICRRRGVRRLAVFGSILGADFGADSDIDFLAEFEPRVEEAWGSHLTGLEAELAELLGREVEVVDWVAVEKSSNPFRRHGILHGKRLLYAA